MAEFSNISAFQQTKGYIYFSLLLGIGMNITFIVLFIIHTGKLKDITTCASLISWDKGLYISIIIYTVSSLIGNIYKLQSIGQEINSVTFQFFEFINKASGLSVFVCWIGIQVVYFNLEVQGSCGTLGKVNFAYIITNYVLMGIVLLSCLICCCCMGFLMGMISRQGTEQVSDLTQGLETDKHEGEKNDNDNLNNDAELAKSIE